MTTTPTTPEPVDTTTPPVVYEPVGVPLDSGICPPEARFPASYAARLANNDPTQCVPVDPCLPGGTTLWTVQLGTPDSPAAVEAVATTTTASAATAAPPAPQLPSTGLGSLEAVLLVAATIAVTLGGTLRAIADRSGRPV